MANASEIMKKVKKEFGDSIAVRGSAKFEDTIRIPTGIFPFDLMSGGGFPMGRVSVVYGPESSGKTNLVLKALAEGQRMYPDKISVFVDAECLSARSRLLDMSTGAVFTAREVFEAKLPLKIRSYDQNTNTIVVRSISNWIDNGIREVFSIKTSNAELIATGNHKLWARRNLQSEPRWLDVWHLDEDWYLSSPGIDPCYEWPITSALTREEARYLGLMIGDGSFRGDGSPNFSNIDKDILNDIRMIVKSWGGEVISNKHGVNHRIIGKGKASKWHPAKATKLLKDVGLYGLVGKAKFIPEAVFNSEKGVVLELLAGLYLADGTVGKNRPTIALSNISLTIIEQVRELWRRMGVAGTVSVSKMHSDFHSQGYVFSIHGRDNMKLVHSLMPMYGYKGDRLRYWAEQCHVTDVRGKNNSLSKWGFDIHWHRIKSVKELGKEQTYDFTVEDTHSYVVDNIISHNSAFDPVWAAKLGVDVEKLIVIHPEYAEQAVDVAESFLYANDVFMVVLDSIAALTTQNEIESSASKQIVGGASNLVGKLFRKASVSFTRMRNQNIMPPAFIGVNQIRYKIGCFDYNSPIWLADGTTMKIGVIVNQKLNVEVLSANPDGILVPRKVIDWANNGESTSDEWLKIVVAGSNRGTRMLKVTRGHLIFTPDGERFAGDLSVGDLVTTEGTRYYTDEQHEVILGSIFGDGSLRFEKESTRGHLRVGHGLNQKEYAEWKANVFEVKLGVGQNQVEFTTERSLEFGQYSGISKRKGLLHVPQEYVDRLTLRALAIWYLDDGTYGGSHDYWGWGKPSICTKVLDLDSLARFAKRIRRLGAGMPTIKVGRGLQWSGINAREFLKSIAPYVPKCMDYKIKKGIVVGGKLEIAKMEPRLEVFSEPIIKIVEGIEGGIKYDITIEDNHNYLVNGVLVHNTMYGDPETMPGGNAVKFSSSFTVRLYAKNVIDKKVNAVLPAYKETSVIMKKWKVPILAIKGDYTMLMLDHGGKRPGFVSDWNTVAAYLKDLNYLSKSDKVGGGWMLFGDKYQTLEAVRDKLYGDPVLLAQTKAQLIADLQATGIIAPTEESEPEVDGESL